MPSRLKSFVPLLALAVASSAAAADLVIEDDGVDAFRLRIGEDADAYYFLEQSFDLEDFTPFSMVLGDRISLWSLYPDPDVPARFFRSTSLSLFSPSDTDGDGIDDVYEIKHSILNPLDPSDAGLDPDNNGLTYLQEYLLQYALGDRNKQAVSREISVFNTRPVVILAKEAISPEVSVFNTRPVNLLTKEAISSEISVFNTRPVVVLSKEAISAEVSVFRTKPVAVLSKEAISAEVSVFNTRPVAISLLEAISPEVSVQNSAPAP